jgi:probable HAF family extracellular repeat protein
MRDLGTLGGNRSVGATLNAAGQVAGFSSTASGDLHAFFWDGTTMRDLGTLGGNFSDATALNSAGQVAGVSSTASGDQHAFFWDGSTMHDLGTLGGNSSSPVGFHGALNAAGQVVGMSTTASGEEHAFFWDGTTMRDLGTLGGNASSAVAINDVGQVAGSSTTASGDTHATRWTVALTPAGEIAFIGAATQDLVSAGKLSQGQATSFLAKLNAATRQLNGGNVQAAKNILQAFIQQVQSFIADGILSAADGQPLIDAAQSAINQLSA